MDFTVELSKAFNLSPFVILGEDKDKVIMMINYFIVKGEDEPPTVEHTRGYDKSEPQKKKVTNATASGGWW